MKKTAVKNIEIQYDENQGAQIDYIKKIISNNYSLFLMVLGEDRIINLVAEDEEKILDFDEIFYIFANKLFNAENVKKFIDDTGLSNFYIEYLVRKLSCNEVLFTQPTPDIDDDILYALIAYKYFEKNGTFDDFVNYLKTREGIDKILKWLQTETRFQVYNYLLENIVDFLKQNDFEFLENISVIVLKMLKRWGDVFIKSKTEEKQELPSITSQEFNDLFCEFLQSINAPDSWQLMFDDLKEKGKIIYEKQIGDVDHSKCYRDSDGVLKMLITTDGTIRCFYRLAHEFAHYVSMLNGKLKFAQLSIIEFPSIFFEKLTAKFLENKGYQNSVIDAITIERVQNNFEIYMELFPLFDDITSFVNKGPILKADKVKLLENQLAIIPELKEKLNELYKETGETIIESSFFEVPKIDIENRVDKECDFFIEKFIQKGLSIIDGYQYLLGTYLADEVLKKYSDNSTIILKMIQITNELQNTDLRNILIDFDLQESFCQFDLSSEGITKTKKI